MLMVAHDWRLGLLLRERCCESDFAVFDCDSEDPVCAGVRPHCVEGYFVIVCLLCLYGVRVYAVAADKREGRSGE